LFRPEQAIAQIHWKKNDFVTEKEITLLFNTNIVNKAE
jgi:hypothetical protein